MASATLDGKERRRCMDKALNFLARRQHGRSELGRKLTRGKFARETIDHVLADLEKLDYLNDARFAQALADSAIRHKKFGRRRAQMELMKAGIREDVARPALDLAYGAHDSASVARELARKQSARLRRLEPAAARRRLAGMLQRRGFDSDDIAAVMREFLGAPDSLPSDA